MTSANQSHDTIVESSPDEWERWETYHGCSQSDGSGGVVAVYQPDVQLRLEQGQVLQEGYRSDWSDKYPNSEDNESCEFWVMYGQSPVDRLLMVHVDGYSAFVPVPDTIPSDEPPTVSLYEYIIGAAVSQQESLFKEKLQLAGIEVQ